MNEPVSAIVVRISLPPGLKRVRDRLDRAAHLGVPPHVTLVYPWLPATALTRAARGVLSHVARETQPFDVRFVAALRWPGVVYLEPEPMWPFRALMDRLAIQYPEFPPYGGTIAEVIPHLTLVENGDAPLDEIAAAAGQRLPFERLVRSMEVLAEDADGRWRTVWRLPFRR